MISESEGRLVDIGVSMFFAEISGSALADDL